MFRPKSFSHLEFSQSCSTQFSHCINKAPTKNTGGTYTWDVQNINKCNRILIGSYCHKLILSNVYVQAQMNVNIHQLLYFVVSAVQSGEFKQFRKFCVDCYFTFLAVGEKGWKAHLTATVLSLFSTRN